MPRKILPHFEAVKDLFGKKLFFESRYLSRVNKNGVFRYLKIHFCIFISVRFGWPPSLRKFYYVSLFSLVGCLCFTATAADRISTIKHWILRLSKKIGVNFDTELMHEHVSKTKGFIDEILYFLPQNFC